MLTFEQWLLLGGFIATPVLGAVISLIAAVRSMRNLKAVERNLEAQNITEDAQASESYARASQIVADEMVKVRGEMVRMTGALADSDKLILKLTQENADLKDWAERLVHQVKSFGAEPVPFRKK